MTAYAIAAAVCSFLIGSIPFGYLIGRVFYRTDIRASGSGNIGAMNALRTLGKAGAVAVLLLDAAKGFAPVFFLQRAGAEAWLPSLAAACAVVGHCYSPWLRFKGGKGVATSFGAVFALNWHVGLVAVGGWIAGALATQYSSVGSMLGSVAAPVAFWLLGGPAAAVAYGVFAAILIVFKHRENIARLRAGTEGKILAKTRQK